MSKIPLLPLASFSLFHSFPENISNSTALHDTLGDLWKGSLKSLRCWNSCIRNVFFAYFLDFFICLEMRTTNTPTGGLKDCLFWIWSVCAGLFNSFAEKHGHNCSEEWSVDPIGVAVHTLAWVPASNFSCQGKSYSLRKAVNQITCSFFSLWLVGHIHLRIDCAL